jgi:replicative DNA helicase
MKINKDTLNHLGYDYQNRLIAQLLIDTKFAETIIDIIHPSYFEDPYMKLIIASIKEAKDNEDFIPDINSIEFRLLEGISDETQRKYVLKALNKIKETSLYDASKVQEIAIKFCKKKELTKAVKQISKIIESDNDNIENYDDCESIIRTALDCGLNQDDSVSIIDNFDDVLSENFRKPIRTGINGLDEYMNGGLSKGELALILAASGVGKSTMLTKIANTAFWDGYNVLHIFFEDTTQIIQRKHISCTTKINLNEISSKKEAIKEIFHNKKSQGQIKLKRFKTGSTTMVTIKNYIKGLIMRGFTTDIIIIDYIDCVAPSKTYADVNVGEGAVMREFESLLSEYNIAGWTATQGNRDAIKSPIVESNQIGGSVKKNHIVHFSVSIAKSLQQRDSNTANMAILKSRFGKDGIVFDDILFDNSTVQIDMGNSTGGHTRQEAKEDNEIKEKERLAFLLEQRKNLHTI